MPHSDTPARARARGDKAAGLLRCVRLSTRVVKGFPGSVLDVGRRVIRIGEARVVRGYLLMFSSVSVFWRDGTTALRTARVRTICAPVALAMAVKAALVLDRNAAAAPPGRSTLRGGLDAQAWSRSHRAADGPTRSGLPVGPSLDKSVELELKALDWDHPGSASRSTGSKLSRCSNGACCATPATGRA